VLDRSSVKYVVIVYISQFLTQHDNNVLYCKTVDDGDLNKNKDAPNLLVEMKFTRYTHTNLVQIYWYYKRNNNRLNY